MLYKKAIKDGICCSDDSVRLSYCDDMTKVRSRNDMSVIGIRTLML